MCWLHAQQCRVLHSRSVQAQTEPVTAQQLTPQRDASHHCLSAGQYTSTFLPLQLSVMVSGLSCTPPTGASTAACCCCCSSLADAPPFLLWLLELLLVWRARLPRVALPGLCTAAAKEPPHVAALRLPETVVGVEKEQTRQERQRCIRHGADRELWHRPQLDCMLRHLASPLCPSLTRAQPGVLALECWPTKHEASTRTPPNTHTHTQTQCPPCRRTWRCGRCAACSLPAAGGRRLPINLHLLLLLNTNTTARSSCCCACNKAAGGPTAALLLLLHGVISLLVLVPYCCPLVSGPHDG